MDLQLPTPSCFPAFPYDTPYDIQLDLMRHLYTSIEQRKVTIVESPTGTGKTLSLLCASLTWLEDEKSRARKGKMKEISGGSDLGVKDWVIEQTLERARRDLEADELEYEERLAQARKREEAIRRAAKAKVTKKIKLDLNAQKKVAEDDSDNDDQYLPDTDQNLTAGNDSDMHISPALRALMAKVDNVSRHGGYSTDPKDDVTCTKIFYASRTHSQLAQVLPEMSKLKFPGKDVSVKSYHPPSQYSLPQKRRTDDDVDDEGSFDSATPVRVTRAVSLGSRKQLCINDELRQKTRDLDEACRELLGEKEGRRCQYLPPIGEEEKMLDFRDQVLASPKDIEDLANAGRMAGTCPYFGSRRAIPQAELVTLPYNLLLQKSAREALGINLKDQIILIDEAHNLIPTLLSLSTTRLLYTTLVTSLEQVCGYVSRFRTRLSAINMLHLKRLVVFLDALKIYSGEWEKARGANETHNAEVISVAQLVDRMGKKVAGINLLEIESYLKRSKVARKIACYSDKRAEKENDPTIKRQTQRGAIPPLRIVEDFMLSLTSPNNDGRITLTVVSVPGREDTVELKYQLLNPAPNFMDVVEEARAVVLAGGTMSPMSDVVNQLFSHLPLEKFTSFSCGHIIPEENLQTLVVNKGPDGGDLEFKADKQNNPATIAQLGQVLLNFMSIVPAGMIVFFPSYKFLNIAKAMWLKTGTLDKFALKKPVFFEPEANTEVEKVLQEYATAAASSVVGKKGGATLFAVIGAKLSEGLNFADDLARCVVIVGLPYANLGSPELVERMKYVKSLEEARASGDSFVREKGMKDAGAELYENMCMNAVNQSIGRAIRHGHDWASLLLLDRRYGVPSIRNKLPKWIGSKLLITGGFGQTVKEMGAFYRHKRP